MQDPKDVAELRAVIGFFNFFSTFLVSFHADEKTGVRRPHFYKELIHKISIKYYNDTSKGRSFRDWWGDEQRTAFNRIKDLLLAGVHLAVPLSDRSMHMHTDMPRLGWGAFLYQINDDASVRTLLHINGVWGKKDRYAPPPVKEGKAWCLAFEACLPMVRCSGHVFHSYTDSLPCSWMNKANGRRSLSRFRLAEFDDVEFQVHYSWISGAETRGQTLPARRELERWTCPLGC